MEKITHAGIVDSIEDDCIHVRILQSASCSECKISGHCNASEQKEKIIDVFHHDTSSYKIGQNVMVYTNTTVGYRATMLGYGLPLVIMVVVLFVVRALTGNDGTAALCGLAALIPYFFVIYLMRNKIREIVDFKIESK